MFILFVIWINQIYYIQNIVSSWNALIQGLNIIFIATSQAYLPLFWNIIFIATSQAYLPLFEILSTETGTQETKRQYLGSK